MKRLIILVFFATFSTGMKAQTFAEWFGQKDTQKKYLLQQIAALQVYTRSVQQGYWIAKEGLKTISDLKNGALNGHKNYFNSLQTANPKIRSYSKVAGIILLQANIIKTYKEATKGLKQSGTIQPGEMTYIAGVFDRFMHDCAKTIEALITLTTSGELQMKDDERLKRIDAVYRDMQEKYTFLQGFSNEANLLAGARTEEQKGIQEIRALSGIKNK